MKKGVDYPGVGVTFICHDGNGNVLMHRRTDKCRDNYWCWDCGGGGIEFGETIEQAFFRELNEEYLVTPLDYTFLGHREHFKEAEYGPVHWLMFDYKALVDPKQVSIGETDKADKLDWFSFDSLPNPLHNSINEFFPLYRNHFLNN